MHGGRLIVRGAANITVGDSCHFRGGAVDTELVCGPDATIVIGHRTGFNYGVSLRAKQSIRIGEQCMFGALVIIRDNDGTRTAPVVIGDRVWFSHAAIIEPGVTIGDDAVIAAGSVVVGDVPPRTMAVGNPARCVPLLSLRRTSSQQAAVASPE
jgi:acetyltransferase-like isoleucine patch superfamily enzyme